MAIIEVNSQDHEREFDLSYSSDEPTIGGGKGNSTVIFDASLDSDAGTVSLIGAALLDVATAYDAGKSVYLTVGPARLPIAFCNHDGALLLIVFSGSWFDSDEKVVTNYTVEFNGAPAGTFIVTKLATHE